MEILAFGHQKRVGKDTCASFVQTYLRTTNLFREVRKRGFADKVKSQAHELYGWGGLQSGPWYDQEGNEKYREIILPKLGKTPRQLWIGHGMACRTVYADVWVDYLLENLSCDFLIITDMRFPNEAEKIKRLGGKVIKIIRPDVLHTSDPADDPLLHYTGWNSTIVNDSDLAGLNRKVIQTVKELYFERSSVASDGS